MTAGTERLELGTPRDCQKTEVTYFGVPGVCFDIDGGWWHEPGSVTVNVAFERWLREGGPMPASSAVKCCGVVGVEMQGEHP